ncbi:MAG: Holliday junction branch migration protein RuvA [Lachnospiraceae bacterium]|nr:Holliday junction branch migration protein RuvA [Lachnospiraceae bacterium]
MYSYIKGVLAEISENEIVIEAAGAGYSINVPASVLGELPPQGTELKIYTHFSVKEDEQTLYGFLYKEDREMFRQLITVSGIGPKGALAILSVLSPSDLRMAIATGDSKSISMAQGIGKKTAERVILELRDKVTKMSDFEGMLTKESGRGAVTQNARNAGPVSEAIDALTVLGYSRMEAGRAVGMVNLTEDMTTEDVLKAALKTIRV